ncbi:MAG: lysophospholipid acyltransferase family protein, partial [Pseudomonadota bacterium]|nr:lysophospholipid acyltransferase family protein [Pseudomonadota bacterium]
ICIIRPFNRNNSRIIAIIFSWARFVMNVRVDVRNRPSNSIQGIYVANHQSTLDMYMYGESLPDDMAILGKHSLMYIPLFGVLFWLAGNIFINRGDRSKARGAMEEAATIVREKGCSVYMFPEGTRSNGRGLLPFKSGAFILAIEAGLPIVPICASSTHKNIDLKRWRAGECRLVQLPAISTEGLTRDDAKRLADEVQALMAAQIDQMDADIAQGR